MIADVLVNINKFNNKSLIEARKELAELGYMRVTLPGNIVEEYYVLTDDFREISLIYDEDAVFHSVALKDGMWIDTANGIEGNRIMADIGSYDIVNADLYQPYTIVAVWPDGAYEVCIHGKTYVYENDKLTTYGSDSDERVNSVFDFMYKRHGQPEQDPGIILGTEVIDVVKVFPAGEFIYFFDGWVYAYDGEAVYEYGRESRNVFLDAFADIQGNHYAPVKAA